MPGCACRQAKREVDLGFLSCWSSLADWSEGGMMRLVCLCQTGGYITGAQSLGTIHCLYRLSGSLLQSLAAEVVALEEKVLQVRSREIRLEKKTHQLQEGLQEAEKQLQGSRQDRASLQSTIEMLQVHHFPLLFGSISYHQFLHKCDVLEPGCYSRLNLHSTIKMLQGQAHLQNTLPLTACNALALL